MIRPLFRTTLLSTLLSAWILMLSTAAYLPELHAELCSHGHSHDHHGCPSHDSSELPGDEEHGCAIDLFNDGFTADIHCAPSSSQFLQLEVVASQNWDTPVLHKGYTQPARGPPLA